MEGMQIVIIVTLGCIPNFVSTASIFSVLSEPESHNKNLLVFSPVPGEPCEGQIFASYPGDCSKYYHCEDNLWVVRQCAAGTLWNENELNCDFPQNVDCSVVPTQPPVTDVTTPRPVTSTTTPTTTTPTTTTPNTTTPTTTTPTTTTPTTTTPTTTTPTTTTPTTTTPTTTTPTTTTPVTTTPSTDPPTSTPPTSSATNSTAEPITVTTTVATTSTAETTTTRSTNPTSRKTDATTATPVTSPSPEPVTNSTTSTTSTTTTRATNPTTTTSTTTPLPTTILPRVKDPDCVENKFYVVPGWCQWFYECSSGWLVPQKCPITLLWNESIGQCDYPTNVTCEDKLQ